MCIRDRWVTVQYTVGVVVLSFGLGLGTALMLNVRFPLRGLARALIIIPWATPWLVTTLIWYVMFNPQIGPINAILKQLGLIETGVAWLHLNGTAMPVIILVTAWRLFPTTTLLVLAALQSISPELYEAAEVDGAGWLGKLRYITLPGISATSFVSLVLVTISAFKLFTVAWVMTAGGPGSGVVGWGGWWPSFCTPRGWGRGGGGGGRRGAWAPSRASPSLRPLVSGL